MLYIYIFYIHPKHYRRYISHTVVNSFILTLEEKVEFTSVSCIQSKETNPVSYVRFLGSMS